MKLMSLACSALLLAVFALGGCAANPDLTGDSPAEPTGDISSPQTEAIEVGCADGQREGLHGFANIAACSGAWSVPGVKSSTTYSPHCNLQGGNNGAFWRGDGCSVADMCAPGWHVCESALEVYVNAGNTNPCNDATLFPSNALYITHQSGVGNGVCSDGGLNDVFGCGNFGRLTQSPSCSPLPRFWSWPSSQYGIGYPWIPDTTSPQTNATESLVLIKANSNNGGVLCCKYSADGAPGHETD